MCMCIYILIYSYKENKTAFTLFSLAMYKAPSLILVLNKIEKLTMLIRLKL